MSRPKSVSIAFQTDKRPAEYVHLAKSAEAHGFDGVSVFADLGYQPPWQPLALMAASTTRVRLGPACVNPFTTHPVDIAGNAAVLEAIAPGRTYVGITKGTWLDQVNVRQAAVPAAIADTIAIVRLLLAGDDSGWRGEMFSLAEGFSLRCDPPAHTPPVLVGAWGPHAVAVAGAAADELKVGGTANPDLVPIMRSRLEAGTRQAAKAARDVELVFGAVTVVDADGEAARRLARTEVAMYLAVLADLDPTVELPPEVADEIRARVAARDHHGAGAAIPDHVLDRFAFAGTPAEVADHACRLFDAGVDRVEFGTPHGISSAHGVELLGRQVLPAIRSAIGP